MKLFIDTSQSKFAAFTFDNNKIIDKQILNTKFKVESIINFFNKLKNVEDIKEIYINIGPGSFVGSRVGLLYVRTLCQINGSINLYTTNTFSLLKKQKNKLFKKYYISATKQKSYVLTQKTIKLIPKHKKESEINYQDLIENFNKYEMCFKLISYHNLMPLYGSQPQIGS